MATRNEERETRNDVVWITGGGTGIGRALAESFYEDGARVFITGRRPEPLLATITSLRARGGTGTIDSLAGDASDRSHVEQALRMIEQHGSRVTILINNAGVNPYHPFEEASLDEFADTFRINVLSAIQCTKAVLPSMRAENRGSIVNISSVLGKWASSNSPAYSVSKYALSGFTDSLRQHLAGTPIHVMGVYPGFIRTPMTAPFVQKGTVRERMGKIPEAMAKAIRRGLQRQQREVQFPWYVPVVLSLHALFPQLLETLRRRLRE